MTTSISGGGSVSSAGIGSGLDVNSIISKLMSVEKAPLTQLQTKATAIQTTISTYGAVSSAVSSFRDAALALTKPSTWSAVTGTSSDPSAVSVSTSSGAMPGNYSIQIQNLASAQSTASGGFASGDAAVGSGTLHIDLGAWSANQAGFTAQSGSPGIDIAVTATDTLSTLADKINAAGAGVSASIFSDANGSRLVLTSSTTGSANGFRVTALDDDGNNTDASGLSALAFDPAGGASSSSLTQAGANANATINGLAVDSASNTLSNVLQGLTVNLLKVSASPVQLSVAQDTTSIKAAITGFVTTYNALSSLLATDVKYDSGTSTAGPLQGDSTAVSLQRQLRNILGSATTASSAFSTLSQAGLQVQADGTIKVDDGDLSNALANSSQLKALFSANDPSDASNSGFATQFRQLGDSVLGSDGLLTARVAGLNFSLTHNQTDQDKLNTRLNSTEARLRAQYTALDTKMASLSTLNTYITQQIANWNKPAA